MNNSEIVYREILQKSLNRITDEIILLETQNNKLMNIVTSSEKRIERLKLEREQISQELKQRIESNETKVDGLTKALIDNRIKGIAEKQDNYSMRIQELQGLKREVNSNVARAIINRRINHERQKIARLRSTTNIISDIQKAMMMSKHAVDRYRLGKYAKRQGNVNYYENKVNEIDNRQSKLNPEENIIDKAKSTYYDIRGKHYAKKLDKSRKLLKKLQQKGVQKRILGANVAAMSKKAADKLRKKMQKQMKEDSIKEEITPNTIMQNQPDNNTERRLPAIIQTTILEEITASSLVDEAEQSRNKNSENSRESMQRTAA